MNNFPVCLQICIYCSFSCTKLFLCTVLFQCSSTGSDYEVAFQPGNIVLTKPYCPDSAIMHYLCSIAPAQQHCYSNCTVTKITNINILMTLSFPVEFIFGQDYGVGSGIFRRGNAICNNNQYVPKINLTLTDCSNITFSSVCFHEA